VRSEANSTGSDIVGALLPLMSDDTVTGTIPVNHMDYQYFNQTTGLKVATALTQAAVAYDKSTNSGTAWRRAVVSELLTKKGLAGYNDADTLSGLTACNMHC